MYPVTETHLLGPSNKLKVCISEEMSILREEGRLKGSKIKTNKLLSVSQVCRMEAIQERRLQWVVCEYRCRHTVKIWYWLLLDMDIVASKLRCDLWNSIIKLIFDPDPLRGRDERC